MALPGVLLGSGCETHEAPAGARAQDASSSADAESENDVVRNRVARVLREYDAQGIHRTGTAGDHECARWLVGEARDLGVEAELERISFRRIEPVVCRVQIGDTVVEGVPFFDGTFTGSEGVTGLLGRPDDENAEIGIVEVPPSGGGGAQLEEYRRSTSHRGIVAVTGGERWGLPEGLALLNAESYRNAYGPPGLQVGSQALPLLQQAAGTRTSVRLTVQVDETPVEVANTVAVIAGRDPELDPLVVMTPRSGWWRCASERGGGIAVWVEMLAVLVEQAPLRNVHFVASTGHELGHYGLEHYLEKRRGLIAGARAWVHLGANFGAAVGPHVRMQFSDEPLRRLTLDALSRHGLVPGSETPIGERPFGEARNVFDAGGRYISILGRNGLFHHSKDVWPEAVDVPRVVAFARTFRELAVELTAA